MSQPSVAVVTGGARGLGLAMARELARYGCAIALLDVLDETADAAAALAADCGVSALGLQVDVRDAAAVQAAFEQVTEQLGLPDVLVTAAGITIWGASTEVTPDEWQRVIEINLNGTFYACQSFARGLLAAKQPGSAILISSMSAHIVNVPQFQASYHASKAAVSMLAKSLAVEWAKAGIRVNAIEPGYMLSDMTRQFTEANPDLKAQWVAAIPAGRMGEPEDLLGLVRYLAGPESRYLTGQGIVIDGGYTAI
ncbi:MAG: SDR family oxidoreductase [Actinomycetales bacterium]